MKSRVNRNEKKRTNTAFLRRWCFALSSEPCGQVSGAESDIRRIKPVDFARASALCLSRQRCDAKAGSLGRWHLHDNVECRPITGLCPGAPRDFRRKSRSRFRRVRDPRHALLDAAITRSQASQTRFANFYTFAKTRKLSAVTANISNSLFPPRKFRRQILYLQTIQHSQIPLFLFSIHMFLFGCMK